VKKLLAIILLMSAICSGADYSRFVRTANGIEVGYAWAECPVEMLNEPIPEAAMVYMYGQRTDEQGNAIPHDPLTLRGFVLGYPVMSLDSTTCIIAVAARSDVMYRISAVSTNDLAVWDGYLTAYGYDSSKWLTMEQYQTMMQSERYNGGEE
jgi:hypothetical protein